MHPRQAKWLRANRLWAHKCYERWASWHESLDQTHTSGTRTPVLSEQCGSRMYHVDCTETTNKDVTVLTSAVSTASPGQSHLEKWKFPVLLLGSFGRNTLLDVHVSPKCNDNSVGCPKRTIHTDNDPFVAGSCLSELRWKGLWAYGYFMLRVVNR